VTTIRTWVCTLLFCAAAAAFPAPAHGDPGFPLVKGTIELAGLGGTTLPITLFRAHKDHRLTLGAFQAGRVMTTDHGRSPLWGSFELLFEVAPMVVLRQPEDAFGFAASPLHMRWNFRHSQAQRVGVFAEASGGILYTNKAVPARTTTFNFIDQAGFGVRLATGGRYAWIAGYRFQHISNAGRVKPNPGVNFNFIYVGLTGLR
jgi:lipid A 3-O-deacylase PagL